MAHLPIPYSVLLSNRHLIYNLFKLSRLRPGDRGNPVRVSRAISALVNSAGGDGGVIEGRWSEPYPRGTSPWDWNGSVAILKEYMEGEGRQPVRYGQCWVFSAVVVTGTYKMRAVTYIYRVVHLDQNNLLLTLK